MHCTLCRHSSQGDQLLRGSRVDGDDVVKVLLGGAHPDGHPESLQHLVAPPANHVETDHFLALALADELHVRLLLPRRHGMVERGEGGLVHLDAVTKLVTRLLLRDANRACERDNWGV